MLAGLLCRHWGKATMTYRKLLGFLCCLGSVLLCSSYSCNRGPAVTDLVTIHYRHSANLQSFEIPSGCTGGGSYVIGGGVWALYEITEIDNNDSKAVTFTMNFTNDNTSPVFVSNGGQTFVPGFPANPGANACLETVNPTVVVPPNTTSSYVGRFFVNITNPVLPADNNAHFDLLYRSPQGQPVIFVRDPGFMPTNASGNPIGQLAAPKFAGEPIFEGPFPITSLTVCPVLQCTSQLTPPSSGVCSGAPFNCVGE
jgi:hypothetical protein